MTKTDKIIFAGWICSILTALFLLAILIVEIVSSMPRRRTGTRPDQLGNLILWVRSDSLGKSYSADAQIDSIKNLGSVGNWFTQGTAANRPLFRTGVSQTGLPGIDFDGSNDNLAMPSSTTLFNSLHNDTDNTVVAVFMCDALNVLGTLYHNNNITSTSIGDALRISSANRLVQFTAKGVSAQPVVDNQPPDQIQSTGVVHFVISTHSTSRSPNFIMRVDTLDRTVSEDIYTASASNATANLTLGHSSGAFNGKLLELFAYSDLKSAAQIRGLETYLIDRYYSSFTPLTFATRIAKPRTFFEPSGAWADSLIRAYAFTPEDSVMVDSVKDWSSQNVWAVEVNAPAGGPGNYWCNELVESPGMNIGGRQDRRLQAGNFDGLGITDKITVAQRVRITNALTTTGWGVSFTFRNFNSPFTRSVYFDDIDYVADNSDFGINTGTASVASMGTLGIPMQYVTIVGTYAGDSIRVYLDGIRKAATVKTGNIIIPASNILEIGANSTQFFIGNVLMTCVWKRVLTDAEIAQIAADPYIMFAGGSKRRWLVQSILPEIIIEYYLYALMIILVAGTGLGIYRHFFYERIISKKK